MSSSVPLELWKVADAEEAAAWEAAGSLGAGSTLDKQDGFIHTSDAKMVREVAKRFFAGKDGLKLLRISIEDSLSPVACVPEAAESSIRADLATGSARVVIHVLPDGCAHIYHLPDKPVPWAAITSFPLLLGSDGGHIFPPECT